VNEQLRRSYRACAALHARHGRSYFLATRLLPAWKRPHVHALYGFARWADEVVDNLGSTLTPEEKATRLTALARDVARGGGTNPIAPALADTMRRWSIPQSHIDDFLAAMAQDLTQSSYKTYEELAGYMHGSAVVIGWQMLPVLEPVVPLQVAAPYAADLGTAFQLTNFLRDVGEDLSRGRLYLPLEDLDAFGVTREQLERGHLDSAVRRLLAFEIARTRELYRSAWHGIRLLDETSRPCITAAFHLYRSILDEIERQDYPVLHRRVAVPRHRRLAIAGPALVRSLRA